AGGGIFPAPPRKGEHLWGRLGGPKVDDALIKHLEVLAQHTQLDHLEFSECAITNDGLRRLAGLKQLEILDLTRMPAITDQRIQPLQTLSNLHSLTLFNVTINDKGLNHLKAMTGLTALTLCPYSGEGITDEGLKHLRGMTRLSRLGLSSRDITDKGLAH